MAASQPEPSNRVETWKGIVDKHDKTVNVPEVVYVFSNGVEKTSTDRTESGVYRRP